MKLTISTVALVALAATVGAAAAGASQDRLPDAQRPAATMDAPGMTITGCVARGATADTFTLAEAKKGAPVAADATTPAPLVTLAGTQVDLSKHVGHSVALTGSYATDGAVGTSGTEKPPVPAASEDSKKAAKTFTVKSLTMVSTSCS